jgi:hypothetical protein
MQEEPYRRLDPPSGGAPPQEHPTDVRTVLVDALDLGQNLRGIGWSWSHSPFPAPSDYGPALPLLLLQVGLQYTAVDAIHYALVLLQPSLWDPAGTSIFNAALPPVQRTLVAVLTTLGTGSVAALSIDLGYAIAALLGRTLRRDGAARWPTLFNRPWAATSLADFWARRWHALFARQFGTLGGALGRLCGARGALARVLGAFALSALLHDLGSWALGHGADPAHVGGFFVAMGAGVLFERVTPWRPAGVLGACWTYVWVVAWGMRLVDSWARAGLAANMFLPERLRPGRILVRAAWKAALGGEPLL